MAILNISATGVGNLLTKSVTLFVSVSDSIGRPVSGLKAKTFKVGMANITGGGVFVFKEYDVVTCAPLVGGNYALSFQAEKAGKIQTAAIGMTNLATIAVTKVSPHDPVSGGPGTDNGQILISFPGQVPGQGLS